MAKASVRTLTQVRPEKLPSAFATLEGWWSADSPAAGQVSGTALKGNLPDKSGKGRPLVPLATPPTWYESSGPAGTPVIQSNVYQGLQALFSLARPITVMAVCQPTDNVEARDIVDGGALNTLVIQNNATGQFQSYAGAFLIDPRTSLLDLGWHVVIAVFDGASSRILTGGSKSTTGDTTATTAVTGLTLGTSSINVAGWVGAYAEAAIFSENMALTDINRLGSWAAQKYGLGWDTVY